MYVNYIITMLYTPSNCSSLPMVLSTLERRTNHVTNNFNSSEIYLNVFLR